MSAAPAPAESSNPLPSKKISYALSDKPAVGDPVSIAPGVWLVRLPYDGTMDHVNAYVLQDHDELTLVDAGIHSDPCRDALHSALDSYELLGKKLTRVIGTHFHPDHVGLAGHLCESGAEFVTTRTCWLAANLLQSTRLETPRKKHIDFVKRAGMSGMELEAFLRRRPSRYADHVGPLPQAYTAICQDDVLRIGDRTWHVHIGNGHCDDQVTLWSDDGLAIVADQILPNISPSLSVHYSEPLADNVSKWLQSCRRFIDIAEDETLCLPGHGLPFRGAPWRCEKMIDNCVSALNRTLSVLTRPMTAIDCIEGVYRREIRGNSRSILLGEIIAYLNHLQVNQLVTRSTTPAGACALSPGQRFCLLAARTRMKNQSTENQFDTIVIGSGMGSLATASILAQVGKQRVLVLESHFKLGGFMHSFRRKGYTWDPGVHYIGEMHDGAMTREAMDLVTGGEVKFNKMTSPFETYIFPDETFGQPSGEDDFRNKLIERFPAEKDAIERYFKDVKSVAGWLARWFFSKQFRGRIANMISMGRRLPEMTTGEYLDQNFKDPLLKGILAAQWPDFGTPPDRSAFGVHGVVVNDFLQGGYYPIGGSQKIADCAAKKIEEAGGKCLVSHPVSEILIRNNRAIGVKVDRKGKDVEYYAKRVVSGCGVRTTFNKLVPNAYAAAERAKVTESETGTSALIIFLGLKDDPRKHGFTDTNYWIYNRVDHLEREPTIENPNPLDGAFLSFGSLRDPCLEKHSAQVITFSRQHEWEEFVDTNWKKRGAQYTQEKKHRMDELLDYVESQCPGLRDLIDYAEVATPLSVRDFTGHSQGAIYGSECTPDRLSKHSWSIGTSVKKLYLTGTDLGVPGVNSALMLGVMTAGKLLGLFGMPRVMWAMSRTSSTKKA